MHAVGESVSCKKTDSLFAYLTKTWLSIWTNVIFCPKHKILSTDPRFYTKYDWHLGDVFHTEIRLCTNKIGRKHFIKVFRCVFQLWKKILYTMFCCIWHKTSTINGCELTENWRFIRVYNIFYIPVFFSVSH